MARIIILLILSILTSGCFPIYTDYFEPSASKGEIRQPDGINENLGPFDTLYYETKDNIRFRISSPVDRKGLRIQISIQIPGGSFVSLTRDEIIIEDLLSKKLLKKRIQSIYSHDSYDAYKENFGPLEILEGETRTYNRTKIYKRYYIDEIFDNLNTKSFILISPEFAVNNKVVKIPNILFKLKSGWYMY